MSYKGNLVFYISAERDKQGYSNSEIDAERKRLFRMKISDLKILLKSIKKETK